MVTAALAEVCDSSIRPAAGQMTIQSLYDIDQNAWLAVSGIMMDAYFRHLYVDTVQNESAENAALENDRTKSWAGKSVRHYTVFIIIIINNTIIIIRNLLCAVYTTNNQDQRCTFLPAQEFHRFLLTSNSDGHHDCLEDLTIENPQPRLRHRYTTSSSSRGLLPRQSSWTSK